MKKTVYCVTDGKIGHFRQSEGLALALKKIFNDVIAIKTIEAFSFKEYIRCCGKNISSIEKNSIVIGAGHQTHFALLYYRLKFHAKTIVVMKPSLPKKLFNYCIVPKHDGIKESGNVILTEGAMNALSLMPYNKIDQIIILVGGEGSGCWSNENIYRQLQEKIEKINLETIIILSTTRRTPTDFIKNLPGSIKLRVRLIDFKSVNASWLPEQLLKSREAIVTADSISMVYESLSAACDVTVLDVDGLKDKIAKNLRCLREKGLVDQLKNNHVYLNESERVANKLLKLGLMND